MQENQISWCNNFTSLDNKSLKEIGFDKDVKKIVLHQAKLANKAKLDAIVCSAQEVKDSKKSFQKRNYNSRNKI